MDRVSMGGDAMSHCQHLPRFVLAVSLVKLCPPSEGHVTSDTRVGACHIDRKEKEEEEEAAEKGTRHVRERPGMEPCRLRCEAELRPSSLHRRSLTPQRSSRLSVH